MEGLVAGDVVVVPFPFTDLSTQKVRPALVLARLDRGDVPLCQVTSKPNSHRHAIRVEQPDFSEGGLPRKYYILPQRLVNASSGIVRRRAGKILERKLSEIRRAVCQVVGGEM